MKQEIRICRLLAFLHSPNRMQSPSIALHTQTENGYSLAMMYKLIHIIHERKGWINHCVETVMYSTSS